MTIAHNVRALGDEAVRVAGTHSTGTARDDHCSIIETFHDFFPFHCFPLKTLGKSTPSSARLIWPGAPIATSQSRMLCTAFLPSEHRSRVMQPNSQLDFTENRARKRNWSDRMLGSARILGVQRGDLPDGVFLYIELFDFQI